MIRKVLVYASVALYMGFTPSKLDSHSDFGNHINPMFKYEMINHANELEKRIIESEKRRSRRISAISRITHIIPKSNPYITTIMDICEGDSIITPYHLAAVLNAENQQWNPRAVSPKGAKGLGQLMDGTAKEVGVTNSFNPTQNIVGSYDYLNFLINRYEGNLTYAFAAYNAGYKRVDRWISRGWKGNINSIPLRETREYIRNIMSTYEKLL